MVAKGFDADNFVFDFMEAFDAPKAKVKQLKQVQQNASDLGGVLWRRNLHYIQSLNGLVGQSLDKLQASEETAKQKIRYIVRTDGNEFVARDLKTGETLNCLISELGLHFGFFLPLANIERYKIADENPVDIKATGRLAKLL